MLGQVAAIDYVRADYTWQVDGQRRADRLRVADLVRLLRLPQLAYNARVDGRAGHGDRPDRHG